MKKRRGFQEGGLFPALILFLFLFLIDQFSKMAAIRFLKEKKEFELIKGIFHLSYLENHGAAFGILKGRGILLSVAALLLTLFLVFMYRKLPGDKKYLWLRLTMILLAGGAMGNAWDRAFRGYVVDFLYFRLIDFPVFNVADIYVVSSTFLLCILLIFYYKEEDLK